jgi:hypothetical protein
MDSRTSSGTISGEKVTFEEVVAQDDLFRVFDASAWTRKEDFYGFKQ